MSPRFARLLPALALFVTQCGFRAKSAWLGSHVVLVGACRVLGGGCRARGTGVALVACLAFVLLMSSQLSGDALASQANGSSEAPAISASGRYVAFESVAADLVSGDTNARRDVFVRDGEDSRDDGRGHGQIRDYGNDGRATTDFDFGHDHTGKGDPHAHDWDWGRHPPRQGPRPIGPGE